MIKSLLWKEWREQRWKMIFGAVMILFFAGSLRAARIASTDEMILVVWFVGGFLLALYNAMGAFAPERAGRTITFLVSKPIASWKVFGCKWFFGWLNVIVPILLSSLCLQFTARYFPVGHFIKGLFGAIALSTIFYSMSCCLAPRKSSEALVGFVGLIIFLSLLAHVFIIEVILQHSIIGPSKPTYIGQMIRFINPLYWVFLFAKKDFPWNWFPFLVMQIILLALILWVGLRKWQRSS
jgi:hypothetical protein